MFFFSQFETFDPLSGHIPDYPFTYLPEIAQRARALLKSRSTDQVVKAAKRISEDIDYYFRDAMDTEICRLQSELDPSDDNFELYFEWDGGTRANGRWFFKESMADELGVPTEENTCEVDALKAVIEKYDDCVFFPDVDPEPLVHLKEKDYEIFAVVALWLVADALSFQKIKTLDSFSIAGNIAAKAMEAVCYAEHLRDVGLILSNISKKSRNELIDALHKQKAEQIQEEKQKKRQNLLDLNKARHRQTYDTRDLVIKKWSANPSQFSSAEQAGVYYANWLEEKGIRYTMKGKLVSYQPRAVTGWIRAHAKQIGIKFR